MRHGSELNKFVDFFVLFRIRWKRNGFGHIVLWMLGTTELVPHFISTPCGKFQIKIVIWLTYIELIRCLRHGQVAIFFYSLYIKIVPAIWKQWLKLRPISNKKNATYLRMFVCWKHTLQSFWRKIVDVSFLGALHARCGFLSVTLYIS